jgi:hypothetical protein
LPVGLIPTAAASADPAGIKAIGGSIARAKAAIFPITGTRAPVLAASAIATRTTSVASVTTASVASITTSTSTALATTATATTTTTAATGFGLVDAEGTTHQFGALKPLNGPAFHVVVGHFHKGEASLATCVPLQRQGAVHDVTKTREKFNNVLLLSAEGKIAYKDAHERGWGNRYGCRETY